MPAALGDKNAAAKIARAALNRETHEIASNAAARRQYRRIALVR